MRKLLDPSLNISRRIYDLTHPSCYRIIPSSFVFIERCIGQKIPSSVFLSVSTIHTNYALIFASNFSCFDLELARSLIFGTVSSFVPVHFLFVYIASVRLTMSLIDNRPVHLHWDVHICI